MFVDDYDESEKTTTDSFIDIRVKELGYLSVWEISACLLGIIIFFALVIYTIYKAYWVIKHPHFFEDSSSDESDSDFSDSDSDMEDEPKKLTKQPLQVPPRPLPPPPPPPRRNFLLRYPNDELRLSVKNLEGYTNPVMDLNYNNLNYCKDSIA